jgi:citrate lyase beta subunit
VTRWLLFCPGREAKDLDWARRVLGALTSDAAIKVDGQMIDKPLVEKATRFRAAAGES